MLNLWPHPIISQVKASTQWGGSVTLFQQIRAAERVKTRRNVDKICFSSFLFKEKWPRVSKCLSVARWQVLGWANWLAPSNHSEHWSLGERHSMTQAQQSSEFRGQDGVSHICPAAEPSSGATDTNLLSPCLHDECAVLLLQQQQQQRCFCLLYVIMLLHWGSAGIVRSQRRCNTAALWRFTCTLSSTRWP